MSWFISWFQKRTVVTVENLVTGSRGKFRSFLAPEPIAEWAFMLMELEDSPDPAAPMRRKSGEYCDNGFAALAVSLERRRATLRYHAIGDRTAALEWFILNGHLREDGCIGSCSEKKGVTYL